MDPRSPLRLGPLLRYVDRHEATIWVETTAAARVAVRAAGREWSAPTFRVEGHHYALVVVTGLAAGSAQDYDVTIDGQVVWPPEDPDLPPPRIVTLGAERPVRLAFGSCRTSVPHDAEHHASHGVDALRALAVALAKGDVERPDVLALLGDQVYADETSPRMREFIASRRDPTEPPGEEVKDYEEYAHLYRIAWSDPLIRWVLSTVPSAMIFDDHDVRDDWNTSWSWHRRMNATEWWHERLVGALTSYWVYQHVGNLSPGELAEDQVWSRLSDGEGAEEIDLTEPLRDLAERSDRDPEAYRWSYARGLGESKLVVLDSRAARVLEPDRRAMLDPRELAWLDEQVTGDVDHLFLGTSLPFLLPPGLHDAEAISEAFAAPDRPALLRRAAETVRQVVDLEHWGAFQSGFTEVFDMVLEAARGQRGRAPASITFLSGDVHHSYVAQVAGAGPGASAIVQAVCSPIRNPMPRGLRSLVSLMAVRLVRPMRWLSRRTRSVTDPVLPWRVTHGPWFDNSLAVATVLPDSLRLTWLTGDVAGDHGNPRLREVAGVEVRPSGQRQPAPAPERGHSPVTGGSSRP